MIDKKKSQFPQDLLVKIFICILAAATTIYLYIEKQNDLTVLRLAIPVMAKEVRQLQDENTRLRYEINQFESPIHLMELVRKPEFAHLKYPFENEIILIPEDNTLSLEDSLQDFIEVTDEG